MRTDCRVTTHLGLYILFQLSGYTSDFRRIFHKLQQIVGCEGLELHILHRPHIDSIDLDRPPKLGIWPDNYKYGVNLYFLTTKVKVFIDGKILNVKIEELIRKILNPFDGRNYGRHHLKDFVKQNASEIVDVLDIGAGKGEDLWIVKSEVNEARIVACEWDQENCEKLQSLGALVFQCDLEREKLPFDDLRFDLIIADQIFEHMKDIFWVSHEVSRTLKVGGFLYIAVPNLASFHNRILLLFGHQPTCNYSLGPHVRGYTVGDLEKFFRSGPTAVWELVSVRGSNFYPFPKPFSTLLARLFPKAAVGSVLIFKKASSYSNHFLELPKGLETNFYVG